MDGKRKNIQTQAWMEKERKEKKNRRKIFPENRAARPDVLNRYYR